ncbi:MAG: 1,4-dihydroxy-2-naphthoate polyprenyltransferase [Acidimicrobiia bacterium]|nr:1,4-dihydroxy-2-naphthoate polyprenyltransferase [Acidimicrobiia bacterium]
MTSWRAWVLAARPPTLLAAVSPVLAGAGLAVDDGAFRWDAFVVTLVTAVLLNVGVNFANDASDAARGADTPDRLGPPRAVATGLIDPRAMWRGVAVVFGLAIAGGAYLAWIAGPWIVVIGVASILAALGYTGGPVPYGYRGLGEAFVFVFFGVVATVGSRFVHDGSAPLDAWLASVPIGFLVTAILVANNVRDLDTDRRAGKRTLAVLLGRRRTEIVYAVLVLGAFAVLALFAGVGWMPRGTLLGLVALPLAIGPVRTVTTDTTGPALVGALVGNARAHAVLGALVGLGAAL